MGPRLSVCLLLMAAGCLRQNVNLDNRSCADGDCADGYVCNPLSASCTPPVTLGCNVSGAVCPSDLQDADPCETIGSFVPCADGTNGCESGCRLCDADHTWSSCSCTGLNCACFTSNGGVEVCDGFDNDCHGGVDDGENVEGCTTTWVDNDGDGFGTGDSLCFCGLAPGRAPLDGDSNDNDPAVNPDAGEVCDGIDNNGDGRTLARETDDDHDGYVECDTWVGSTPGVVGGGDCNDIDADIHPGAVEVCDGISNSCQDLEGSEVDKDGDGWVGCANWVGTTPGVLGGGDCDISNGLVYPGAPEIYDVSDNDCDGKVNECLVDCDCGETLVSCWRLDTVPTAPDQGPAHDDASVESGNGTTEAAIVDLGVKIASGFYLEAPNVTAHDLAHFSLSVWAKAATEPGSASTIRYIVDVQSQYGIYHAKSGDLTCFFQPPTGAVIKATAAGAFPVDGSFRHIGCSYGGSQLKLYVNGALVKSTSSSLAVTTAKTGTVRIGSNSIDGGDNSLQSFDGTLDHLKIFTGVIGDRRMCMEGHATDCGSL